MSEQLFSGNDTIALVKQLIRYDIPFLLLGKSSIGKSYSILEMTRRWRMPHSLLYIGSEKPSNIEGLPRLTGKRAGSDTLEFYKPAWFPSTFQIEAYVSNGKDLFDKYINKFYSGDKQGCLTGTNFRELNAIFDGLFVWEWDGNTTTKQDMKIAKLDSGELTQSFLNEKAMVVERELISDAELFEMQDAALEQGKDIVVRDDVRDLCLYLSTLLGYGNFWLILDELDKVDEAEQDKYAPLLHIVRERIIKEYSMRTLNDGRGAGVPKKVLPSSNYSKVKADLDEAISLKMPLLDTRIIGIANATEDIEDALFRRFCHLIVEQIMYVSAPPADMSGMRKCLADVTKRTNASALTEDLEFKLLNEVNLQWQFGFFPTMMNPNDATNNFILENFLKVFGKAGFSTPQFEGIKQKKASTEDALYNGTKTSALFKIIRNNFGVDADMDGGDSLVLQKGILRCLASEIVGGDGGLTMQTAGDSTEKTQNVRTDGIDARITNALKENGNDPVQATEYLLEEANKSLLEVDTQADHRFAMENLLGLVEQSAGTSLREPMLKQFYPLAIRHAAKPKSIKNWGIDQQNKSIQLINKFIQLDVAESELYNLAEGKGGDVVNPKVLFYISRTRLEALFVAEGMDGKAYRAISKKLKDTGHLKLLKSFSQLLLKKGLVKGQLVQIVQANAQ